MSDVKTPIRRRVGRRLKKLPDIIKESIFESVGDQERTEYRNFLYRGEPVPKDKKPEFIEKMKEELNKNCTTIAVLPSRLPPRMIVQNSVFTLHGGKAYTHPYTNNISDPVSFVNEKNSEEFLTWCIIDKNRKKKIKDDLFALGVHEGTLFPELDKQANYLKEQWLLDKKIC